MGFIYRLFLFIKLYFHTEYYWVYAKIGTKRHISI